LLQRFRADAVKDALPRLNAKAKEDTSAAVRSAAGKAVNKIEGK
jgi:hypothetical protein